ncbi:precorrin-6A synthase [Nocardioides cavernae]|uniref:Precorrin-6A synthase n=1 Tax=Nocardioides cavernae TaxID=1921566 RepID=A0A7Y9H2Y0_9ACTN|nr:precorrin-6A synthase (deacetylating) [Nocardioides cavernae]NYE36678.1 precorrin-6A synthase [Nocardioides cavernae]
MTTTTVRIVGIGCHPGQLTGEAREAVAGCDYVIAADKGSSDGGDDPLLAVRRAICAELGVELVAVPDPERDRDPDLDATAYDGAVLDWHDARAAAYGSVLGARPGTVGFLVWGDPAFYDSTIRVVERLDVPYDVLPGVSALSLLAARHRVVLHEVGRPVLVTTGRRLADDVAAGHDNLVVMLDGRLQATLLAGDWDIWWGANLGSPHEELVAGRLGDVEPEVRAARARARDADGWVMDTYLLRRRSGAASGAGTGVGGGP